MTDTASDDGVVTFVAQPDRQFVNQKALDQVGLRKAMWIMTPDGIAILTGCDLDGVLSATLCKDDGRNVMKLDDNDQPVPDTRAYGLAEVRIAYLEEIPAGRIAYTDLEVLAALGYVPKESAA